MKIVKILNNNAVEVINDEQNHAILIGRGIGFANKKKNIDLQNAEQIFVLTNKKLFSTVENLISTVSTDVLDTSNIIVNYGKNILKKDLNENIIITLTDHLDYAIARARDGYHTPNPLNIDIKRFYPKEYKIGLYALKIVERKQFTHLNESEAGFIAMHFVDASMGEDSPTNVEKLTEIIKEALNIVEKNMEKVVDKDSISYSRFVRHIQYMAIRVFDNSNYSNIENDSDLRELVLKKYDKQYEISKCIQKRLKEKFKINLDDSELMYLTLHIVRLYNT
ncbi:PRD domain-containing protein [Dellaglioa sp. BT-FLS60]